MSSHRRFRLLDKGQKTGGRGTPTVGEGLGIQFDAEAVLDSDHEGEHSEGVDALIDQRTVGIHDRRGSGGLDELVELGLGHGGFLSSVGVGLRRHALERMASAAADRFGFPLRVRGICWSWWMNWGRRARSRTVSRWRARFSGLVLPQ